MRRTLKPIALACGALLAATSLSACSGEPEQQVLTVFAAASLSEVFVDIAKDFEADHEGVEVKFSFAGSSDLVSQLESGAPANVFASANEKQMERAKEQDVVKGVDVLFASNTLTLVTPADNPAGITSLADAADSSLVICAPQVPCGAATEEMAEEAGITLKPVSEENSVTDVLGKVTSGQADAGLVYVTDAIRAGDDVKVIDIPEADSVVNFYPVAAVRSDDTLAQEFVDFIMSEPSQAKLRATGFGSPVE
ncbi:molybdate ABC transporter substrate-binding protein [Tessaracoccus antarcticus]|uniref:Molybdate ABC transporter substrate-binding protein n=1 Tax=Tessaracoccus antarcticus TaxID=2479848 RepID=A0A3M0GCB9_9ACTN|nr:molybdate ABC transporter substrate-binding protein [Tessaracoccus antarcticus]RMB62097.1 molybdate ABC transporter substrate-binding protein [Tessaracoccus antarcticus]